MVSIGPKPRIKCDIQAGTHPEQDVLCGTEDFMGAEVIGFPGGAKITNFEGDLKFEKF